MKAENMSEQSTICIMLWSEVDKPSKILIKTSTATEYIESDIQNLKPSRATYLII